MGCSGSLWTAVALCLLAAPTSLAEKQSAMGTTALWSHCPLFPCKILLAGLAMYGAILSPLLLAPMLFTIPLLPKPSCPWKKEKADIALLELQKQSLLTTAANSNTLGRWTFVNGEILGRTGAKSKVWVFDPSFIIIFLDPGIQRNHFGIYKGFWIASSHFLFLVSPIWGHIILNVCHLTNFCFCLLLLLFPFQVTVKSPWLNSPWSPLLPVYLWPNIIPSTYTKSGDIPVGILDSHLFARAFCPNLSTSFCSNSRTMSGKTGCASRVQWLLPARLCKASSVL